MPYDYKVTDTSFAGPTCFQRGDTLYINQRGERVALQRSTAIRYRVRQAKEKKLFAEPRSRNGRRRSWTRLEEVKLASSTRSRSCGTTSGCSVRCRSATSSQRTCSARISLASFTTEWRALPDDHVGWR